MKKNLFFPALALTALVGCSENDVVSVQSPAKIDFAGSFVENATRAAADPSTTTGSIKDFDVWGFMDSATGIVFEDEDVTKNGSIWSYKNIQYWSPAHTYYFAALSPMNSENITETIADAANAIYGLGEVGFTNVDGTEDLLYAAYSVTTPSDINTQPDPVKFQFNHLLSKVKFTFSNGFTNENTQLVVKEIKMEAPKKGAIDLAQADWWSTNEWELDANAGNVTLEYGDVARLIMGETDECADERLTIPADATQAYKVTFIVDLYQGDVLAQTFNEETTITGVALEIGKAYNFKAELNATNLGLYPIEFDAEVKDWVEDTDFQEEFTIEADNEVVTLVSDGNAATTIQVKNNGVIDGAGHTMSIVEGTEDFLIANTLRYINVTNGGSIMNMTIDGNNVSYGKYGIRGIFINGGGVCTIDNVQILNCTYGINTGSGTITELNVLNSTLQGWNSWDNTEVANFTNVKFIAGTYANVRPYHSTTFTNCTFGEGVTLDLSCVEEGQILTLVDCYNAYGEIVTADNVSTIGVDDASKIAFNTSVADAINTTVTMNQDGIAVTSVVVENGTLNGSGYTLTVAETPGDNGIIRPEGTCTIENLTIDGQNKYYDGNKGMRAIYINAGGTYTINNVITKNVTYPINVNVAKAEVTLNVSNSTLEGWTSYGSSTTATFDNVNFTKNETTGMAYFRPYGNTTLKDCNFAEGFKVDCSRLTANGTTISFENCYLNGVIITAANIEELVDSYDESVIIYVK